MEKDSQISQFDEEMLGIYQRALSEAHYKATRFLSMLSEHGGLETARILIHSPAVSEGYTALWQRGRLDLTVEAVIIDYPKWHSLFTEEELGICRKRLSDYEYSALPKTSGLEGTAEVEAFRRTESRHRDSYGKLAKGDDRAR
jgi:hypothetical protein